MRFTIDEIGGNCPVQAWGTCDPIAADGSPHAWFFWSRGQTWKFEIDSDGPDVAFLVAGSWGDEHSAGYMDEDTARELIVKSFELYDLSETTSQADRDERASQVAVDQTGAEEEAEEP